MSERIDVLEVLDDVANALANYSLSQSEDPIGKRITMETRAQFRLARDILTELIDEARYVIACEHEPRFLPEAMRDLSRAISRTRSQP